MTVENIEEIVTKTPVQACGTLLVSRNNLSPADWDDVAARCGASFRGSYRAAGAWQFDHHKIHRLQRLAIWRRTPDGRRERIGQAAIGLGPRLRAFAEGLQLLPEHAGLWNRAMAALLAYFGPGQFHYGSQWNLEGAREGELASIAGVTVGRVQAITLHAVDFSRWPSWDAYLREVSSNARRNAAKALKHHPDLRIDLREGTAALREGVHLLRMRRALYARKQIDFSLPMAALRLMLRSAVMGDRAFIATARAGGQPMAAFGGILFGANTYYLDGASSPEGGGANWYMMLQLLQEAFARSPRGYFVTGAYHEGDPVSDGVDFFRQQCRTTGFATSEVSFGFKPI